MLTSGVGNGVGDRAGSALFRLSVLGGTIDVGSSPVGTSCQRQKRVSSFGSQLLHSPMMASANTPFVGRLIRDAGTSVEGYRLFKSTFSRGFAAYVGSRWIPWPTGITMELPANPMSLFSTTEARLRCGSPGNVGAK